VAELAADHGGGLGDLLDRGEAVETGHQRILEGRRDGQGRERAGELAAVAGIDEQAGLEHRLGQLFDEQRHAVGARHDLVQDLVRQRLTARDSFDHCSALAPAEAIERQGGDVRVARPRRIELGPVGEHGQHRQGTHPLDEEVEQLQSRRVDPVHVLIQLEHRAVAGETRQLLDQEFERALLLPLGTEVQRRVALATRDSE
jgi:hypothetical protein